MSTSEPPPPVPGARLLFTLDPSVAHLDHGGYGATPISVQRAQQRLREEVHANPGRALGRGLRERVAHTRRHLAGFVGADPGGCAFVLSVDAGIAMALQALELDAGHEIVTLDTCRPAVRHAVEATCRAAGARHHSVALPGDADPQATTAAVAAAITARTRLVVVDQVARATARWLPVEQIAAVARRAGAPVLVDGTATVGAIDVAVSQLGVDFWVGDLHTWAFAPRHTALLVAAPRWRDRLRALVAVCDPGQGFPADVEPVDQVDVTTWLAAPAGVFAMRSLGVATVQGHNRAMAAYGQAVVGRALGAGSLPGSGGPARLPVSVVPLPAGVAATPQAAGLLRQRIAEALATEVAVTAWRGTGLLRLSAQVYNLPEEYDRLAAGLPGLLRRTG